MKVFILFLVIALTQAAQAEDWIKDWFDSSISSGDEHYESQKRGFYSLGSYRARMNTSNDYLLSANLPRIRSGCGGIDLFAGGLSFLDEEYLVEKFQNMIQAAPAIAFDIALKVMSNQLSESMKSLESIIGGLNNLQLNDCAITKRVFTEVAKDDGDVLGGVLNEIDSSAALRTAVSKSWQDSQETVKSNDGEAQTDLKKQITGCSEEIKDYFSEGSVLKKTLKKTGMGDYHNLVRGLVGDVIIVDDENIPVTREIARCPHNSTDVTDMMYGYTQFRDTAGKCFDDPSQAIIKFVEEALRSISNKISDATIKMTEEEETFIKGTRIPVVKLLSTGKTNNNMEQLIQKSTEVIALDYAGGIFDDLYRNAAGMFSIVQADIRNSQQEQKDSCNLDVYAGAVEKFERLAHSAFEQRKLIQKRYAHMFRTHMERLQSLTTMAKAENESENSVLQEIRRKEQ